MARLVWKIYRVLQGLLGAADAKLDPSEWGWISHSQEGEDAVLWSLLGHQSDGFYVDVGAHHPVQYSNTCLFYRMGWHGINIDADPDAVVALEAERPRDINLHVGVGMEEAELEFVRYDEGTLNTFNKQLVAERRAAAMPYETSETIMVRVLPLSRILHEHLRPGHRIDFLSVDVEGKDFEALRSSDWQAFRPRFVLVECFGVDLAEINDDESVRFLTSLGYVGVAKTANTAVLKDAR